MAEWEVRGVEGAPVSGVHPMAPARETESGPGAGIAAHGLGLELGLGLGSGLGSGSGSPAASSFLSLLRERRRRGRGVGWGLSAMCSPWSLGTVAFAAVSCAIPEACVSCCLGSGRGHRAGQNGPCVGRPEPLPISPFRGFAGCPVWGYGRPWRTRLLRSPDPPHPSQARSEQPTMGWGGGGGCTPRPPIHQQPPERRVVTVVFLGLLLDLLAFTLLLPLLPGLLESHGRAHDPLYGSWQGGVDWFATAIGMPVEKRYNSVLFGGLIGSAFSVLQFLCAPLTGATSDCLGRRPVMLLCLMGVATSYAVWATSRSFAAFLASRLIGGISKGNVSLSTAIVADLGSPLARSQGMAVIGVAFSLGFTLGPMLGASLPLEMAPWFALLFAASDLLFIFCFLPETLPLEKRAPSIALGFRDAADLLSPLALLRFSAVARGQDPPSGDRLSSLRRLGLVYFLYLFLFSGLEYTLSFLTHQRFQFSSLQQGKMFFLIGLTMATIQGAYARRIHPGGEVAAVKRALLLLVPAFLLIGWGRSLPVLGLGLLLYSFAAAVVVPCLSSVVAGYGSPGQKGTVMGTLRSLGALARAAGPLVAASVYWLAGAQACFTTWSGLFLLPFFLLQKLSYPAQTLKAE
ncbi:major facilitator superfamily domain-containing protein 10 isoform X4 [Pongo pygmaeus]|uniref:major facilitator superfamily domain-containing protein 10 isoform X4 n=1 Tax=Pongo pygmaeus TaxID=9600 RepID=UPI0023E312E2|nr:major facilitator superfamily domain-containing protein 10 isoform X3 [Pongo abelii]XP_054342586.1 major facilitator superfamily domain-containing protein 10 isoform X3 [Pongo pygmaeus]